MPLSYPRSERRVRLRGDDSLSDLPRPERLGFVMKYLWALKGSSPGAAPSFAQFAASPFAWLCGTRSPQEEATRSMPCDNPETTGFAVLAIIF